MRRPTVCEWLPTSSWRPQTRHPPPAKHTVTHPTRSPRKPVEPPHFQFTTTPLAMTPGAHPSPFCYKYGERGQNSVDITDAQREYLTELIMKWCNLPGRVAFNQTAIFVLKAAVGWTPRLSGFGTLRFPNARNLSDFPWRSCTVSR